MGDIGLSPEIVAECASTSQAVAFVASSRLRTARSLSTVEGLIRKVDVILDNKLKEVQKGLPPVACQAGCSHCCHRVVIASAPEVFAAAAYIDGNFQGDQKSALQARLRRYLADVGPRIGHDLGVVRTACPLLIEGLCSIYEARPLACRAQFSLSVESCIESENRPAGEFTAEIVESEIGRAATDGLSKGLKASQVCDNPIDFARALDLVLNDPLLFDGYMAGQWAFGIAEPVLDSISPPELVDEVGTHRYSPGEEASGFANNGILEKAFYYFQTTGDAEPVFKKGSNDGPLQQFFRVQVPMSYNSEQEVESWRERVKESFDEFSRSDSDVREKFDAISVFGLLSLSYQQKNDRDLLATIGDYLTHEVSAKVFPDLNVPIPKRKRDGKIRVGYIGTGLGKESGCYWASGWLKNHSEDFETFALYLNAYQTHGAEEFQKHADHYYHCTGPVGKAARFIKQLKLDVLIYPDTSILGRDVQFTTLRLAPIQCVGWGAPETTGMPNIDYFLSSEWMEPEDGDSHYRETLIRLPRTGMCYPTLNRHGSGLSKADFGLDDGPLFLCAQAPSKLHPKWDWVLKKITDRSRRPIVFFKYPFTAPVVAERRLKAAGVNAIFLPWLSERQFFDMLSLADVTLDAIGWSGGITSILALQQGRPVITLPGEFRRGRHAMAFLKAANVPALIAKDPEDYVDLVLNDDRRTKASNSLTPEEIFEDTASLTALEDFLRQIAFA